MNNHRQKQILLRAKRKKNRQRIEQMKKEGKY